MTRAVLAILAASMLASCTTLYPEDSPEREREHEFQEFHVKHLRR